jgi:hypothetical protein
VRGAQEAAIANKQNFTSEEWIRLLESPMLVGIAVSAADPSGLWGTLKEAAACSSALSGANRDSGANELVQAVRIEFETSDGRSIIQQALRDRFAAAEPSDCVSRSLVCLREVSVILAAKAPGDAAAFKTWLNDISRQVAEASMEGSFLGFGGMKVSDAEKATLADIAESLGGTV